MLERFEMADNPPYLISNTSKLCLTNLHPYIVAHAVRNRNANLEDYNQVISDRATGSKHMKNQNHLGFQMREAMKDVDDLNSPQNQISRLPSNMLVSKTATRRPLQNNIANSRSKFDLSNLRKIKLQPPVWRGKENYRKTLQSAKFHNRRKIEEILAMKATLKLPRYDPNDLLRREQTTSHQEGIPRLYNGCRIKPLVMESEDPFPDNTSDTPEPVTSLEQISNEKENIFVFSPTPADCSRPKFVWNPVILPAPNSFVSATELLDNCSPRVDDGFRNTFADSPGNRTTSSASSGLTVAEETLRLTYYTERFRDPSDNQCHHRSGNYSYSSDPLENSDLEWILQSRQPDLGQLRQGNQSNLEWLPQSCQPDIEWSPQTRHPDFLNSSEE